MPRRTDPRGASRRGGTDAGDLGYTVANDAPAKPKRLSLGRKAPTLSYTGCHLYQAAASPQWFPGTMAVYQRCPRHQPAASLDLGEVAGHCIECDMEPFTVVVEQPEY